MKGACIECGGTVSIPDDAMLGEIVSCPDCGVEFEVKKTQTGLELAPAPKIEEDWGE